MEKNEKLVISDYFRELPEYKKIKFRERVKSVLEISESTFYKKIRESCWKSIEIDAVVSIIEQNDYA